MPHPSGPIPGEVFGVPLFLLMFVAAGLLFFIFKSLPAKPYESSWIARFLFIAMLVFVMVGFTDLCQNMYSLEELRQ